MAEGEGGNGAIRELIALFGFGVDTKELDKGENRLEEFLGKVKQFAAGIAAAFAVKEIYDFAEANVKAMHEVEHAAARVGISAESVQKFQFAAASAGEDGDALLRSMGRLQVSQEQASQGSKEAAKGFHTLGVNIRDTNGHFKQADELFLDVAEGISKIKDPTKQAAAVTELFGRQGRELLPILKRGREGFAELNEEYKKLGGGYSAQAREEGEKFEEQAAKTNLALTSLRSTILVQLLPVVTRISKAFSDVVVWLREMTKNSNIVQATLVVLGAAATVFGIQLAIAFAPVLVISAALLGLVLIIDDLITMFKGGDSLTGRWIDSIWGKDAHLEVVKALSEYWKDIKEGIKEAVPYIKDFYEAMKGMAKLLTEYTPLAFMLNKLNTVEMADRSGAIRNALSGGKGRGGMTMNERLIAESAKQYVTAEAAGESPSSEMYTVPKGMSRESARAMFHSMVDEMHASGWTGGPQVFGPASMPPVHLRTGGGMGAAGLTPAHRNVTLNVHVPANPKPGKHTTHHDLSHTIREAAVNIPRAGNQ